MEFYSVVILVYPLWTFVSALCYAFVLEWPTFWDVHGVQAAQQVPDKQFVTLLPTQPVVAGKIEAQMGPVHVGHHHPVQEPAGVHPRVVVLNPGEINIVSECDMNSPCR